MQYRDYLNFIYLHDEIVMFPSWTRHVIFLYWIQLTTKECNHGKEQQS